MAEQLQYTLTWDTLYHMVDTHILDFVGMNPVEVRQYNDAGCSDGLKNRKKVQMVELKGGSWTIQVPLRIKD